jgi:hypothetical protein
MTVSGAAQNGPGRRNPPANQTAPFSKITIFVIERNYRELGFDRWDTRRVQLLCAKFGDTPEIMSARLRIRPSEFQRRMESDCWTKQDGMILSILEREIEFLRGGKVPAGRLVAELNPQPAEKS